MLYQTNKINQFVRGFKRQKEDEIALFLSSANLITLLQHPLKLWKLLILPLHQNNLP